MSQNTQDASSGSYAISLVQESGPDGDRWTAAHPALLGCHAVADDPLEAVAALSIAREAWLKKAADLGWQVPAPKPFMASSIQLAPDHSEDDARAAREACNGSEAQTFSGNVQPMAKGIVLL